MKKKITKVMMKKRSVFYMIYQQSQIYPVLYPYHNDYMCP